MKGRATGQQFIQNRAERIHIRCRPDFAVLIYPGYLVQKGKPDQLAEDIRVSKETPPTFFVHAANDNVLPENSITMFLALKKAGVKAELNVYPEGGHGFGLRPASGIGRSWPGRCEEWMRSQGLLTKGP